MHLCPSFKFFLQSLPCIILFLASSIFPYSLTSFRICAEGKHHHSIMLPPPYFIEEDDVQFYIFLRHIAFFTYAKRLCFELNTFIIIWTGPSNTLTMKNKRTCSRLLVKFIKTLYMVWNANSKNCIYDQTPLFKAKKHNSIKLNENTVATIHDYIVGPSSV